ncbi:MAG TPA: LPS export ABC transporter permease LptF [Burkholderiaceae bacterium]|nr:LPS export ABC transporter permease LptF [Burkholderiaceae bacterium]
MLFKKALRRDLANLAGVIFATLFTIMVTTSLIRLLGRAANGSVDTASVLPLIAFASVNFLPVLLVLTLYVAVLMALTRAYRDSEMVIWFASGQSVQAWIRPVLQFALPFVLLIALVAFLVAPWANRQTAEFQKRFEQREDIAQVSPGQFRESASANRVFFVESVSEDQSTVRNVFVTQTQGDNLTIVVSSGGRIQTEANGDRFLVLEQGRRYDGVGGRPEFKLMEFERYGVRLEPRAERLDDDSSKIKTTLELIETPTPRNLAELLWRISLPVSAVLLALLAIPLSSFNPRVGRSVNLMVALLIYVVYNNLVSLAQGWVAQGRVRFEIGVFVVHLGLAVVILFLFYRRLTLFRWPWRLRRAERPA